MHPAQQETQHVAVKLRGRVSGCALERGVRVGRSEPGWAGGAEPPQVFLFLDAAHGRVQVLLFTFESVRK